MSFISYAQNFEDVMLWRALKHVEKGCYIDVGANDPVIDSVSKAFYDHGWRGIHVEPTEQYSNKLRQARPDEIVEQVAISDGEGTLTFYEFLDTGLSTADPDNAKNHIDAGFKCIETVVPILTLDELFKCIDCPTIHWIKIDVEGLEKSVLQSWKKSPVRPWVLLIESTSPMSQEENFSEWEELVLYKGYIFAYFDGLNRFYVHSQQSSLLSAFRAPPNIFDGFQLSGMSSHPFYTLIEAKAQLAEAKAQLAEAKAQLAEACLQTVYNSRSWKLTMPLRWIAGVFRTGTEK